MMKKKTYLPLFILLCLLVTACSTSPGVNTNEVSDVDFSKFDSYAYLPSGDTAEYQTILEQKVVNEVNLQMEARGYELDTEEPDLLVLVKTMFDEEERLERDPMYTSYNYYTPGLRGGTALGPVYYRNYPSVPRVTAMGGAVREVEYTEGTFVVDVIDRSNNSLIWRGWSETPVDETNLDESIRDYIANIFGEYPVAPENAQ